MKKIDRKTENGAFNWLLAHKGNACHPEGNSDMIRGLVGVVNELIEEVNAIKAENKKD